MNTQKIMWDSFVNLMDIFHTYVINFMVHKLITLLFMLEAFLTSEEKPYSWPTNADFVGTMQQ